MGHIDVFIHSPGAFAFTNQIEVNYNRDYLMRRHIIVYNDLFTCLCSLPTRFVTVCFCCFKRKVMIKSKKRKQSCRQNSKLNKSNSLIFVFEFYARFIVRVYWLNLDPKSIKIPKWIIIEEVFFSIYLSRNHCVLNECIDRCAKHFSLCACIIIIKMCKDNEGAQMYLAAMFKRIPING